MCASKSDAAEKLSRPLVQTRDEEVNSIFYIVALILFILSFVTLRVKHPRLQPIVFALYGITSLLFAIFENSSLTPIFMIRYFFYISGAFMTAIIPFFLLLFAALVLQRTRRDRQEHLLRKVFGYLMVATVMAFTLYTVWIVWRYGYLAIMRFMSIYVYIAMYLIATFISYILLNFGLKYWPRQKHHPEIIVLGARIDDEGVLSSTLRSRLQLAVESYLENRSQNIMSKIIVTGGSYDSQMPTEAEEMGGFLLAQGIPAEDIILESRALNTDENFYFAKSLLKSQQAVLVVTSSFHLIRAFYFAWQNGVAIELKGAPSSLVSWGYNVVREYLAFLILTKEINFICMTSLSVYSIFQLFRIY